MNEQQDYYDFIRLLTGNDRLSNDLSLQLCDSDAHPADFIARHRHLFSEWQVDAPHHNQTLYYLIDALIEQGYVRQLHPLILPRDINRTIRELCPHIRVDDILEEEDTGTLSELLEMVDNRLQDEYDLTVLFFPLPPDGHAIAVVQFENWEELDSMLEALFG